MDLNDRERLLVKLATASAIKAVLECVKMSGTDMDNYRIKTQDDPRKKGYYDTHRQFFSLEDVLEQELERRVWYDDDTDGYSADLV